MQFSVINISLRTVQACFLFKGIFGAYDVKRNVKRKRVVHYNRMVMLNLKRIILIVGMVMDKNSFIFEYYQKATVVSFTAFYKLK